MNPEIRLIPTTTPLSAADAMPLEDQDAVRRIVPASTVGYQDGHLLLSREGVLHMAEEIISGRTVGNVEAAQAMKTAVLRDYPKA